MEIQRITRVPSIRTFDIIRVDELHSSVRQHSIVVGNETPAKETVMTPGVHEEPQPLTVIRL